MAVDRIHPLRLIGTESIPLHIMSIARIRKSAKVGPQHSTLQLGKRTNSRKQREAIKAERARKHQLYLEAQARWEADNA